MKAKTNNQCPDMPEWLKGIEELARQTGGKDLPADHLEILRLYRRALDQSQHSATELAERFESGQMPCGVSHIDALFWHEYATELGSAKSKLRLAQWYLWHREGVDDSIKGIEYAKEFVANVVMSIRTNHANVHAAAISAKLLLEFDASEESKMLVADLLNHEAFMKHPDHHYINARLREMQVKTINAKYRLKVTPPKIAEDGDFKLGVYKALEQPLNLVSVADVDLLLETLNQEFPWFKPVNEIIYRQLVARQLSKTPAFKLRPLLLAGPPGVGKTSYVKRLSELCQVPFRGVMAAGSSDAMYLRGTPRGWSSARPSGVIQAMVAEGIANPLFLVDELEKASSDNKNGRIWDTLLQLLEPATAKVFLDECLCVPCDLSWVSWVATVNEIGALPKALLERFTVVVVKEPGPEYVNTLVKGAMDSFAKEMDIDSRFLPQLDGHDLEVIARCNGPREINRMVRSMVEKRMIDDRRNVMRN